MTIKRDLYRPSAALDREGALRRARVVEKVNITSEGVVACRRAGEEFGGAETNEIDQTSSASRVVKVIFPFIGQNVTVFPELFVIPAPVMVRSPDQGRCYTQSLLLA
jgi:hypothetical protein